MGEQMHFAPLLAPLRKGLRLYLLYCFRAYIGLSVCFGAVKFFNSEDGKPWKSSVKDVSGEVCGRAASSIHLCGG